MSRNNRNAHVPWFEREYSVNRSNARKQTLVDKGYPSNSQFTVTMPPELAESWYFQGAVFRWEKVDDDTYLLRRDPALRREPRVRWSKDDMRLLDDPQLSNADIAAMTGRTADAVAAKRWEQRVETGLTGPRRPR